MNDLEKLVQVRSLTKTGAARAIRNGAQVTQSEIAEAVGVSISTVCRWELGERRPQGQSALRYAEVLNSLVTRGWTV